MGARTIITEDELPTFRREYLSPEAVYAQLLSSNEVLYVGAPPGVGKTFAAHGLVAHALKSRHDLVVYIAPTRALISELLGSPALVGLQEHIVVLERRPSQLCGALGPEWSRLEKAGCATLARVRLCSICPNRGDCTWPDQFDQIDGTVRLVICTEAYLGIAPGFIRRVVDSTRADRPLVVFDEASFLTTSLKRTISIGETEQLRAAVAEAQEEASGLESVVRALDVLLDGKEDLGTWPSVSRYDLLGSVIAIQEAGRRRFGESFRYIGSEIAQLTSGSNAARWYADDAYHYVPNPDTAGCDVIVFSPYLPPQIIEERLDRPLRQALPAAVFRHSETRVINITDPVGALRTLSAKGQFTRVADVYAALVLRDHILGRRSVLVTKKHLMPRLKSHVETLAAEVGYGMTCRTLQDLEEAGGPQNGDVALINYGILGVNSLQDFDALYCFGGYYARQSQLDQTYNQSLPPENQIDLVVRTQDARRRVMAGDAGPAARYHARRALAVLEMIERRVVLQAVGRVRPFTSPATVVLFQQDDFADVLGQVETYDRLSRFRGEMAIPTRTELLRAALGDCLRPNHTEGTSYRALAKTHDLPLSTVYKALTMPPLDDLLRRIRL